MSTCPLNRDTAGQRDTKGDMSRCPILRGGDGATEGYTSLVALGAAVTRNSAAGWFDLWIDFMEARTSPIPAAIRVAQHRARRRSGLRQFQFFGDEVEVVERLIEAECLAAGDVDDNKAICAALTRFFRGLKFT
jgi:hypothetical protein